MRSTKAKLLVIVAALGMLGAACGGSKSPSSNPTTPSSGGGAATANVTAVDFAFQPTSLTVASGGSVVAVSHGKVMHTFTIKEKDSITADLQPGAAAVTVSLAGLSPGTYHYFCKIHPTKMTGTLTITG